MPVTTMCMSLPGVAQLWKKYNSRRTNYLISDKPGLLILASVSAGIRYHHRTFLGFIFSGALRVAEIILNVSGQQYLIFSGNGTTLFHKNNFYVMELDSQPIGL